MTREPDRNAGEPLAAGQGRVRPGERSAVPSGAWPSPFPIELLTAGVIGLAEPGAADGARWWLEGRPTEGGRQVLIHREADGHLTRLTPEGFNARTRVHEYGGGAALVDGDLVVVSDFVSGRLCRVTEPGVVVPLTPADRAWRFADAVHDASRGRLIAVREDHEPATVEAHGEPVNALVAVDFASGEPTVLVEGADFYAAPRLAPDGRRLAWLQWNHPNLPWDGTELWVGDLDEAGRIADRELVAGSASDWISQPRWSPDGILHFVAEPTGWLNLHRWRDGQVERLTELAAEFGGPDWVFGLRSYAFLPDGTIAAVARSDGRDRLFRVDVEPGTAVEVPVPFTEMRWLTVDGDTLILVAGSPTSPLAVVELDPASGGWRTLRHSTASVFDPDDLSIGEPIEFPTTGGRTARARFYAPVNRSVRRPEGERPPLVVTSHGGPTGSSFAGLTTSIQLLTSRGFAVLDVDYGGSTGYGRDYRRRLEGGWGVVDVDDCVAGATWLAEQGIVDRDRMAIRGGSASGFTTLCALAYRDVFRAGVSYYGLGNLELFVAETHKFESRYLERLVGPWPAAAERYRERSPCFAADRIGCPVLVLQGLDDRIVPASEAERIVAALRENGVPHAYLTFPGEDHGFRQAANVIRAFEAELSFYGQVFGFAPADPMEPLEIVGLAKAE